MQTSQTTDIARPVYLADPVNRSHPLNAGRLAWWLTLPGLAGGVTWYDLMGLNHATLTGTGNTTNGWRSTTRPGGFGHLLCDGTNGYATVASIPAASTATQQASFAAWVNPAALSSYSPILLSRPISGANLVGLHFSGATGNPVTASWTNSGGEYNAASGLTANIGEWAFVAATVSGAAVTVYRASSTLPMASYTITITATNENMTQSWHLGHDPGGGGFHVNASLDDLSLWNRQLSAAEVSACYDLSRRGYPGVLNRR